MTKTYFPHIDGLRAIAVLLVILFHLDVTTFSGGYVGVDVFFVISGFLITRIIVRELEGTGGFRLANFYVRRVKRLLPALAVTVFATLVAAAFIFSPGHLQRIGGAAASSIFSVSNFYFWLEADYFAHSANVKPFLHAWSLSIEEQFYLIWPTSLLLLYRTGLSRLVLPGVALGALVSLYLNIDFGDGASGSVSRFFSSLSDVTPDGKSTIFFLLPFRVFEFSIGAALVWLFDRRFPQRFLNDVLLWIGLALVAYSAFNFDDTMLFPYWYALVPCTGAALVIYAGRDACSHRIVSNRLAVGIGLISYSLYLVHWPVIVFWNYLGGAPPEHVLGVAFALAYLLYRFVEVPFRKPGFFTSHPVWKPVFAGTVGLSVAVGLHMHQNNGWTWRVPPPMVDLAEVDSPQDFHRTYHGGADFPSFGGVRTDGPPDIVIMGDSHARHYAEGIYRVIARPQGYNIYMGSGVSCLHLPNFTRTTEGRDWDADCPASLERALGFIRQAEQPPLVIVSHAWNTQMGRAALLDAEGNRRRREVTTDDVIEGIIALRKRIGDARLVVIGNVPGAGANLYDVFARPGLAMFDDIEPESYLHNGIDARLVATNERLRQAADGTGAFLFIDPFDVLCGDTDCRNVDDDMHLMYSDDSHLSKFGSVFVVAAIERQLLDVMDGRDVEDPHRYAGKDGGMDPSRTSRSLTRKVAASREGE